MASKSLGLSWWRIRSNTPSTTAAASAWPPCSASVCKIGRTNARSGVRSPVGVGPRRLIGAGAASDVLGSAGAPGVDGVAAFVVTEAFARAACFAACLGVADFFAAVVLGFFAVDFLAGVFPVEGFAAFFVGAGAAMVVGSEAGIGAGGAGGDTFSARAKSSSFWESWRISMMRWKCASMFWIAV